MTAIDLALILLVEGDVAARVFLADNLAADGYDIVATDNADDGLRIAARRLPDLVVVDVNGGSGRDFARLVRSGTRDVDARLPMILLGSDGEEIDTLRAFDSGADDYVRKPYSYPELRARVGALLRRVELDTKRARTSTVRVGDLVVNTATRTVSVADMEVTLSAKEFGLLSLLASDPSRVWTKQQLLASVWGHGYHAGSRTLDSHACRLRQKLGVNGQRWVVNVWGVGYRLVDSVAVPA